MEFILIFSFCFIFIILLVALKGISMKRRNDYLEAYTSTLSRYCSLMERQVTATRKYRHDLAKHLQLLQHLQESQSPMPEMTQQLMEFQKSQEAVQETFYCRNLIVNALLNILEGKCREKSIELYVQIGEMPSLDHIHSVYLVGVLQNLFHNATEACERAPQKEKRIDFELEEKGNLIYIRIGNTIPPGEKVTLQTHKRAKDEHGYGIAIIRELLVKYHGEMKMEQQDAYLTFLIQLQAGGGI